MDERCSANPSTAAAKARQLADEAVKPDAPLFDISYCWEGLGKVALPVIRGMPSLDHQVSGPAGSDDSVTILVSSQVAQPLSAFMAAAWL